MTAIVVLPICHRSGSSLLASILIDLGVNMGDDLLGPGPGNPLGHFEDREIYKANQALLRHFGASWDRPRIIPELHTIPFRSQMADLVRRREERGGLWGWKDPRTVLTWLLWKSVLEDLNVEYKVIGITRDRNAIIKSLIARSGGDYSRWNRVFWTYAMAWFDWVIRENGHVAKYEDLLETPCMEIQHLAEYLGVPFNREAAKRVKT